MARSFVHANSDFIDTGKTLAQMGITSAATVAFHFYPAGSNTYSQAGDGNINDSLEGIDHFQLATSNAFWARVTVATTGVVTVTGGASTVTAWNHQCVTYQSGANVSLYGNGSLVQASGGTGNIRDTGVTYKIGRRGNSTSLNYYWDGMIAEFAIWNACLTADEVAALAKGYSPKFISPSFLLGYWPLIGRSSPEPDIIGGFNGTLTGTSNGAHPRIIMPRGSKMRRFTTASGFLAARGLNSNLPVLGTGTY